MSILKTLFSKRKVDIIGRTIVNCHPKKQKTNYSYLIYECDDNFGNAGNLLASCETKNEAKKFIDENIQNQQSGWFWLADYTNNNFSTSIVYEL